MSTSRHIEVMWTGRLSYPEAHTLQRRVLEAVAAGERSDTLLLTEHDPVITCGRGTDPANLGPLAAELPVYEVERGGDVTWHGPGQLVGYPILRLEGEERDLHLHLRRTEELLIRTCNDLGCPTDRNPPWTGVWTSASSPQGKVAGVGPATPRKIASIGVAVRRWTTWHGFALNVEVDPSEFARINPCGLEAGVMTSLHSECAAPPSLAQVIETLVGHLEPSFDRRPVMARAEEALLTRGERHFARIEGLRLAP